MAQGEQRRADGGRAMICGSLRGIRRALALALVVVGASCGYANLTVDVRVLRHEYLHQWRSTPVEIVEGDAELARKALAEDGPLSKSTIATTAKQAGAGFQDLARLMQESGLTSTTSKQITTLVRELTEQRLLDCREVLVQGIEFADNARQQSGIDAAGRLANYQEAALAFADARSRLTTLTLELNRIVAEETDALRQHLRLKVRQLQTDAAAMSTASDAQRTSLEESTAALEKCLSELSAGLISGFESATANLSTSVATGTQIRSGTADLRGDPLLSAALDAPASAWRPLFNSARACTFGTNTDIAIVMEDVDKFSVKGVRADSSSASKATFAALGKVMEIAATVSGVPVKPTKKTSDDPKGSPAQPSDAATGAAFDREAQRERSERASQDLVHLLYVVLSDAEAATDVLATTAQRTAAKERIRKRLTLL